MGPMIVLSCSAARFGCGDPVEELIAVSGFDDSRQATRASSLEGPDEGAKPSYAPRLLLSSGAVIRPRRTAVTGPALRQLTRLPRQERYLEWIELARRLKWPEHVLVSVEGASSILCATSSPLAIEATFAGAQRASRIVVEEGETRAWVKGPAGSHVAEIVVPFSRSPHAFSAFAPS